MGNCIRKESPMQWAGEDWGSPESETLFSGDTSRERLYFDKDMKIEEQRLLAGEKGGSPFSSTATPAATAVTEVKIKITRKQLEELLGRMEVQGLSVQQVIAQLMSASDRFEAHERSWRPALQSIPEAN